jgi:hypothetical protein
VSTRHVGDELPLNIWRHGKARTVTVKLTPWKALIPNLEYSEAPRYFMLGGIVFQPLSSEFLFSLDDPPPNLMNLYLYDNLVTPERREIVIISNVLKHPVNTGYGEMEGSVVTALNGQQVRDFSHFAILIDQATGPLIRFDTEDGLRIVLDIAKARDSAATIMRSYGMIADRSEDLQKPD